MPEMRPGHENRTNLYEKAKPSSRIFWAEHEGLPNRPRGLHGTTIANTPEGAIDNLAGEASVIEGRGELKDGSHKFTVYEHRPESPGKPEAVVQGFHVVKDGKTVKGTRNGWAPDLGGAKDYIKGWFDATNGRQ